jgi:hypothetical protein
MLCPAKNLESLEGTWNDWKWRWWQPYLSQATEETHDANGGWPKDTTCADAACADRCSLTCHGWKMENNLENSLCAQCCWNCRTEFLLVVLCPGISSEWVWTQIAFVTFISMRMDWGGGLLI